MHCFLLFCWPESSCHELTGFEMVQSRLTLLVNSPVSSARQRPPPPIHKEDNWDIWTPLLRFDAHSKSSLLEGNVCICLLLHYFPRDWHKKECLHLLSYHRNSYQTKPRGLKKIELRVIVFIFKPGYFPHIFSCLWTCTGFAFFPLLNEYNCNMQELN